MRSIGSPLRPGTRRNADNVIHVRTSRILALLAGLVLVAFPLRAAQTVEMLRVGLVGDAAAVASLRTLQAGGLGRTSGFDSRVMSRAANAPAAAILADLRNVDVAIFHRGPGSVSEEDAAHVREFLKSGKGCVILAADPAAWSMVNEFQPDVLGATRGDVFAGGAPVALINLYPHPIFGGVSGLDIRAAVPQFGELAADAQMIMEGTVGEATAPLAWVRRRPTGRLCHIVAADDSLLADPAYQTFIANAVRWTVGRSIPQATTAVQRTFMPEAYPGAFAVTLPGGPSLCLDPVRGGINYIWDGDFVDLRPRWITKQGEPARIFGPVFYREQAWQPLRAGSPSDEPDFQLRGYTFRDGSPEFHYSVGGRDVFERFESGQQGGALLRRFRVGPGAPPLWMRFEPQEGAEIIVKGIERDGDLACYASTGAGEFTIEIRRKGDAAP